MLFGTPSAAKLSERLAKLEDETTAAQRRAEEARAEAADAEAALAVDLASGASVDAWRTKLAAAEKTAREAEELVAAHTTAEATVREQLARRQRQEAIDSRRARRDDMKVEIPPAVAEVLSTGRAFSVALGKLEALRLEDGSTFAELRALGDPVRKFGIPDAERLLLAELGREPGRELFAINVPIWRKK